VAAGILHIACPLHPRQHVRRRLGNLPRPQLFVRHGRDLNLNIDPVQQGPADLPQISLNNGGGATALARRVAIVTARTGVLLFASAKLLKMLALQPSEKSRIGVFSLRSNEPRGRKASIPVRLPIELPHLCLNQQCNSGRSGPPSELPKQHRSTPCHQSSAPQA
jgi:hypothetical protein